MPINPDFQVLTVWPHSIDIPMPDAPSVFLGVQLQSGGATIEELDVIHQRLIDHLQSWPYRHPNANVTGAKYDVRLFQVMPTDPIPPPEQGPAPEPEPDSTPV